MNFRPLPGRVLVKPAEPVTESAGGIQLVQDWTQETSGTVVSVGNTTHPLADRAHAMARDLDEYAELMTAKGIGGAALLSAAAELLRRATVGGPCVKPGDEVVFSWLDGQEIEIGSDRFLLFREGQILGVLED